MLDLQDRYGVLSNAVQERIVNLNYNDAENIGREKTKIIAALHMRPVIENRLHQIEILRGNNITPVDLTPKEIDMINDPEIRDIDFNNLTPENFNTLYNMYERIYFRDELQQRYGDLSNAVQESILGLDFNNLENLGIEQDNIKSAIEFMSDLQDRYGLQENDITEPIQNAILNLNYNGVENIGKEQIKIVAALSIYKAIENLRESGLHQIKTFYRGNIRDVDLTTKEINMINSEISNINFDNLLNLQILYYHNGIFLFVFA